MWELPKNSRPVCLGGIQLCDTKIWSNMPQASLLARVPLPFASIATQGLYKSDFLINFSPPLDCRACVTLKSEGLSFKSPITKILADGSSASMALICALQTLAALLLDSVLLFCPPLLLGQWFT